MSCAFQRGRSVLRTSRIPLRGSSSSIWTFTWRSWFLAPADLLSIFSKVSGRFHLQNNWGPAVLLCSIMSRPTSLSKHHPNTGHKTNLNDVDGNVSVIHNNALRSALSELFKSNQWYLRVIETVHMCVQWLSSPACLSGANVPVGTFIHTAAQFTY